MRGHVLVVFGTRPEGIKMIPVVKALRARTRFRTTLVTTGQHREMLQQVFAAFGEKADVDLDVMAPGQTLASVTCAVLERLGAVIRELKPDLILVHGDTTTAMASAMAAFYEGCPIGHVEAGLRSHDLMRPWPEEFNRVTIDSIARLLFAPTEQARKNLLEEYNRSAGIFVTGNTGIDAVLAMSERIDRSTELRMTLERRHLSELDGKSLILVTGHRRESFGEGFRRICEGLMRIAARPDVHVLYPVHMNPNVRGVVNEVLQDRRNVRLIDPVEYADMVFLMKSAKVIVTDSGGIQEEGPALGKPVLVMRDVTERPEALATGVVKLIGTEPERMQAEVERLLSDESVYAAAARCVFPYGDGTASTQIADVIEREFFS